MAITKFPRNLPCKYKTFTKISHHRNFLDHTKLKNWGEEWGDKMRLK